MSFDLQEPASSQEAGSKVAAPGFAPNQLHLVLHTSPKVTAPGFAPNQSHPEGSADSASAQHFACHCKVRASVFHGARDPVPDATDHCHVEHHGHHQQQQHLDEQLHLDEDEERQQRSAKEGEDRSPRPHFLRPAGCAPRQCHQIGLKGESRDFRPHLQDHDGLTESSCGRSSSSS